MFVVVLFLCFFLGIVKTQEPIELIELPGIQMLGWGLDLRLSSDLELALKVPLYDISVYEQNPPTYSYPLYPKYTYKVPKTISVRTAGQVETDTHIVTSRFELQKVIKLSLSVSGEITFGADPEKLFKGDVEINYNQDFVDSKEYINTHNYIFNGLYQVVLNSANTNINKLVYQRIKNLYLADPTNTDEFVRFIELHGTHYIDSMLIGGTLTRDATIKNNTQVTNEQLKAAAALSFKNMMGFSEGALEANATLFINKEKYDRESYHKIKTTGGDYSVANFFAGKPPEETIEAWLANLITNAVPIKIRVAEISHLFDDEPELRTKIKNALPLFYDGASSLNSQSISLINSNF